MKKLFVTESGGRFGLAFGVDGTEEEKAGGGNAEALPEIGDGAFKPGVFEKSGSEEDEHQDGLEQAAEDQDEKGEPVFQNDFKPDGGDGGNDQKVEGGPGEPLHLAVIDEVIEFDFLHEPLKEEAADHAEGEEGEPCKDALGGFREEFDFALLEKDEGDVAHGDREPDEGDVPCEGVQRVAKNGLAAGVGHFLLPVKAFASDLILFIEGDDLGDVTFPVGPVDEDHADDDGKDHADGGYGVSEGDPFAPVIGFKSAGHAADGAVTAFEADFEEITESGVDAEEGGEDESGKSETDDILSPGEELTEAELWESGFDNGFCAGGDHPEEEGCENNIDQEAGEFGHIFKYIGGEESGEALKQDQSCESADDGTWQIKFLKEGYIGAEDLAEYEKRT